MKNLIMIILISLFFMQRADAQTITSSCLFYYYDAGGNRIQRAVSDCEYHHHEMMAATDTTNSVADKLTETLFPNPTSGVFSVVFNNAVTDADISITDNLGRRLYSAVVSGTSIPLDITRFAEGIYLITVRAQGNSYQSTVVKN